MTTPAADRAFLDTDVLLAATDEAREDHERALAALDVWPASGLVLYTSGQVLREYLVVATRPVERNGLGMAQADAVANARALRERLTLLEEGTKVSDRLLHLLEQVECAGEQVHDANIIATVLVHGVDTVVTSNIGDFARFSALVRVVDLHS